MVQYFDSSENHQRLFCVKIHPAILAGLFFGSCLLLQPVLVNGGVTRCQIAKPFECVGHPQSNWTVNNDSYNGASQDRDKCLNRAKDYYNYCGYSGDQAVTVKYYNGNTLMQELVFKATRCEIEKPVSCDAHPGLDWKIFYDSYDGSDNDEVKCLKRAQGYYMWCGFNANQTVSATFYQSNVLKQKLTYKSTRCEIEKPAGCPQHSESNQWQFNYDSFNGSDGDEVKCLKRAEGYYLWCGFDANQTVSATFYQNNVLKQKLTYKPTRCEIQKPANCPGNMKMDWTLYYDRDQGSDVNEQACLAQAKVIYNTCGYTGTEEVSATFYKNGVMGKQKLYKGQRCELRKPALCPNRNDLNWEVNHDSFDGVDPDINSCMDKAQEYHHLCGYFKGETVWAAFYEGGQKKQESSYSGTYCQINKPVGCPLHSAGNQWQLNYDNYQGSNLDKGKCLARAEAYRSWCGYANGETVMSSFYSNQYLVGQASFTAPVPTVKLTSNLTFIHLDDDLMLNVQASSVTSGVEAKWNVVSSSVNTSMQIDGETADLVSMKDFSSCLPQGNNCSYRRRIKFNQPGTYVIKGYANAIYSSSANIAVQESNGANDQITIRVFSDNDYPAMASYFVSPEGNDSNSGSINAPFKTVEKARNVVRGINKSMTGDIVVNIRKGLYYLNNSVLFSTPDSGTNGFNVVYKAYDGIGSARFIGGQAIATPWYPYIGGIYYTDIVGGNLFYTFFENGKRAYRARFPNRVIDQHFPTAQAPYLLTTSADISKSPKGTWVRYRSEDTRDFLSSQLMGDQLKIHISNYGKSDWGRIVTQVMSINEETAHPDEFKLQLNNEAQYAYGNGTSESDGVNNRFFFMDDLNLLDAPGEFYLDSIKGRLYYKPYQSVYTSWMIFPKIDQFIQVSGTKDNLVHNIVFNGLSFEFANTVSEGGSLWVDTKSMLYLSYSKNIKVKNSHFSNAKNGMLIDKSQFIEVTNSLFRNMANNGIVLKETTDSLLTNLRIHDVGTLGLYAEGIGLFNSSRNQVSKCEISNSARYGITLRGNVQFQYDVSNRRYSLESPSKDNIIKHLKIFNVNQDSGDTGALHSAAVNYDGDPNINYYDQITINNWDSTQTTHPSVKDRYPDGIFLDWPDATMEQVFSNISIVGYTNNGFPFRTHGNGIKNATILSNVSWENEFNAKLINYGKIGLGGSFPQEFIDSRLIAKWSFEKFEADGTIKQDVDQFDYSGMDAPAVLHNSPGSAALAYSGVRGKAIRFDGIDDYASSVFRLNANQDFTIMFWAKHEQQTSGGSVFRPLVYSGTDMGNNGVAITTYRADCTDKGKLGFKAGSSKVLSVPFGDGQWHMIVLTRENNEFNAYFDGALLGKWEFNGDVNAHELTIAGDLAHPTRRFKGFLDELRIYNYALPPTQIAYFHNFDLQSVALELVRINARRSFGSIEDKTAFGEDLPLEVAQRENRDNQIWIKENVDGTYFRLRNLMTGKYLQSQGANAPIVCRSYENIDNQLWRTTSEGTAYVYLYPKNLLDKVVEVGGYYGGALKSSELSNTSFKHFVIERVTDARY